MPLRILKTLIKSPTTENKHKYYALHMIKELVKINDKGLRQACDVMVFPRLIELAVSPLGDKVLLVYNKHSDELYSQRFYRLLLECMKVWCESFGVANPRFVFASQELSRLRIYPVELRLYHKLDITPISRFDYLEKDMRCARREFFARILRMRQNFNEAELYQALEIYGVVVRKAACLENIYTMLGKPNPVSGKFSFDKTLYGKIISHIEALRMSTIDFNRCRENIFKSAFMRDAPPVSKSLQRVSSNDILFFSPRKSNTFGNEEAGNVVESCPAAPEKCHVEHINAQAESKAKVKMRKHKTKTENVIRSFRIKDSKATGRRDFCETTSESDTTLRVLKNIENLGSGFLRSSINNVLYHKFTTLCQVISTPN